MPRISLIAFLFSLLAIAAIADDGLYDDTLPALTTGSPSVIRMTPNRAFHMNLRDSSGAELGTIANPLQCAGGGGGGGGGTVNQGAPGPSPWPVTAISPIPVTGPFPTPTAPAVQAVTGSATTNAAPPLDSYIHAGIYFSATPTPTPGDAYPLAIDKNANLLVNMVNPLPTPYANQNVTITGQPISVSGPFPTPTAPAVQIVAVPSPVTVTGTVAVTGAPTPAPTITNFALETGGHLANIDTKLTAPVSVSGAFPTPPPVQIVAVPSPVTVVGAFPTPTAPAVQVVSVPSPVPVTQSTTPWANQAQTNYVNGTLTSGVSPPIVISTAGAGCIGIYVSSTSALNSTMAIDVDWGNGTYIQDPNVCAFDLFLADGQCYDSINNLSSAAGYDYVVPVTGFKNIEVVPSTINGTVSVYMSALPYYACITGGMQGFMFTKVEQNTTPWADNISQFGGTSVTLGQKAMTASMPVVISNNQTAFPVAIPSPVAVTGAFPTPPANQSVTVTGSPTVLIGNTVTITGAPTPPPTFAAANGSAPADSYSMGGIYFSATPTPTPGNFYPFSLDKNGNLFVNVSNPQAFPTPYATQTITGVVAVPSPVAVTGSFFQTTQPVSMAAAAISGSNPCVNPTSTLVSTSGATSGTAAVQIIALSGTTKIYICSMSIVGVSGTTPTFSLVQGTGSNCAGSQTVLKHSFTTAAGTLYPFANPVAVSVAGDAVCYLDTGTTPIQDYDITYVQQ